MSAGPIKWQLTSGFDGLYAVEKEVCNFLLFLIIVVAYLEVAVLATDLAADIGGVIAFVDGMINQEHSEENQHQEC